MIPITSPFINRFLFILLLFSNTSLAGQFPLFDGKQTSGILSLSNSGNDDITAVLPVTYDISKSKLKFSIQRIVPDTSYQLPPPRSPEEPQSWRPAKIRAFEFSISLNDFLFDLGKASDFDLNLSFIPIGRSINIGKSMNRKEKVLTRTYLMYSIKPSFSFSQKSNFLTEIAPDTFQIGRLQNYQLGLSSSISLQIDQDGIPNYALGFNAYIGYSQQDLRELSKVDLCVENKSGLISDNEATLSDCKEVLFGETKNLAESVLTFDFSKRILSPFKSVVQKGTGEKLPNFNNPSIYLLTRIQLNIRQKAKPEYKGFLGLSLARVDRQIYTSVMLDVIDFFNKKTKTSNLFVETPNIIATVSLPISP